MVLRRRFLPSLLALMLVAIGSVSAARPAAATTFGGRWPWSGYFHLYYSYSGGHRYLGNVYQGGVNWTNTPTKVYVQQWPGVPYAVHISVSDYWTSETWWGMTSNAPCFTCTYSSSTVRLNPNTMDPLTDFMRTKVATHEFGHSIGLAHPADSAMSVMNQGYLIYNTPQSYDVNDVNRVYP